jgi:hypothetical protein
VRLHHLDAAGAARKVAVKFEVSPEQVDELTAAWAEIVAGKRPRETQRATDSKEILQRAMAALETLLTAVRSHPGTGQVRSIVRVLAALWDPANHPLDMRELRGLDTALGNALLDYFNYDRLGIANIDRYVGYETMVSMLRRYGLLPAEDVK